MELPGIGRMSMPNVFGRFGPQQQRATKLHTPGHAQVSKLTRQIPTPGENHCVEQLWPESVLLLALLEA